MNLMNINNLYESELDTAIKTTRRLKGVSEYFPRINDIFLKIPYFFGDVDTGSTETSEFQNIAKATYMQLPYTFRSLCILYDNGYYLEGMIIFRHLIESFIMLKYFNKYPAKLVGHITQTKRVNFSAMFNEFSMGFNDLYYKSQYSEAAHGLVYKDIHRTNREDNSNPIVQMGCDYNEDHATYLLNNLVPIIYGFLNLFSVFYPQNTIESNATLCGEFEEVLVWLESSMKGHKEANPRSVTYYSHIEKLINR